VTDADGVLRVHERGLNRQAPGTVDPDVLIRVAIEDIRDRWSRHEIQRAARPDIVKLLEIVDELQTQLAAQRSRGDNWKRTTFELALHMRSNDCGF